jgi:hypothetical protein
MLHNVFALTKVKIDVASSLKLAKHMEDIDPLDISYIFYLEYDENPKLTVFIV